MPGVVLLLFPADRLLSAQVRLRTFESFRNLSTEATFRPWWWVPALWLDPLRGFAGVWLLQRALALGSAEWNLVPKPAYGLLLGLVLLSGYAQTFTKRDDEVMLAPVGFVAGVIVAFLPGLVATLALVMAAIGLFAFRGFHAFFSGGLVAVTVIGLGLGAPFWWVAPAAGVCALPILGGVLSRRTLEIPTRGNHGPVAQRTQ